MDLYFRLATEVFGQLCLLTEGEPNRLVRGTEGKNGFRAWMRLSERYNSKSPQSMLRKLQQLVKPPDIKQVKGMGTVLRQRLIEVLTSEDPVKIERTYNKRRGTI